MWVWICITHYFLSGVKVRLGILRDSSYGSFTKMPFRTSQGISDAEEDACVIYLQRNGSNLLLTPLVTHLTWFLKLRLRCRQLISVTVLAMEIHMQYLVLVCFESPQFIFWKCTEKHWNVFSCSFVRGLICLSTGLQFPTSPKTTNRTFLVETLHCRSFKVVKHIQVGKSWN